MQTKFSEAQLRDPATARSNRILRTCVHCGFCTATCPTYVVLGDELDSPRGRIYLIKDMLETGRKPDAKTVTHIDRCLSCLACMTTCPSGVHYMHLVDHARAYIEAELPPALGTSGRCAGLLAADFSLPGPVPARAACGAAGAAVRAASSPMTACCAMLDDGPGNRCPPSSRNDMAQVFPAEGPRRRCAWR